jgi:putative membrane protein
MLSGQWANIGNFLVYLAISLPLLGAGVYVFMATTPYKEFKIISHGALGHEPVEMAAAQAMAYDLGGKTLGLAAVLASAVFHAVNPVDLMIWGVIGIIFQVVVFYLFELATPFKVTAEIPKGNIAVGILSAFLSVASGLVLAALISY